MESDLFESGYPIAVICVNTAQFKEFLVPIVPEHHFKFVQVSKLGHAHGLKFSGVLKLRGTDAVPYQQINAVLRGEPLPTRGSGMPHKFKVKG